MKRKDSRGFQSAEWVEKLRSSGWMMKRVAGDVIRGWQYAFWKDEILSPISVPKVKEGKAALGVVRFILFFVASSSSRTSLRATCWRDGNRPREKFRNSCFSRVESEDAGLDEGEKPFPSLTPSTLSVLFSLSPDDSKLLVRWWIYVFNIYTREL